MASGEFGERRWAWAGGALHLVQFGDETVAFHEATASTHVFDVDTSRLVATLQQADGTVSGADLWRDAFGGAPSRSDLETLDESLGALLQAGLAANPS